MAAATIASKIAPSSSFCVDIDPRDESLHGAPPGARGGAPVGRYFLAMCLCDRPSVGLSGLDLNLQFHFLLEAVLVTVADTEVAAIESGGGIRTAHFLLGHRVHHALELIDLQCQRLGDTVQGELAIDFRRSAVL